MERKLFMYMIFFMSAWAEPIEETSTILIPAISATDKTLKGIGPAESVEEFEATDLNDDTSQESAPAMSAPKKDFQKMEKSANLTTHSRAPQDTRPLYNPDKKVHVAGPPDETTENIYHTEKPTDAMPPAKMARGIGNARSVKDSKTTNVKHKSVQVPSTATSIPKKDFDELERPANSTTHSRPGQELAEFNPDKNVNIAGPADDPPPGENHGAEYQQDKQSSGNMAQEVEPAKAKSSENATSSNETKKIINEIASAMLASDPDIPKEKPLHSVDHARQPQDNRELFGPDKQVQVAAPAQPQESAGHNATENPKDVMVPGKSVPDDMGPRSILKRDSLNSSLNSNDSILPDPTTETAKNVRDISGDTVDLASEINPETLKSSKREIQNVANILISSTKHVHNKNHRQQKPQPTVEDPKCPTLAEFVNGTQNLWNGLKTSGGVQDGMFSLFSAMSESVVVLAQCGLKLLNELGSFLNQPNNLNSNQNNGIQDVKTDLGDTNIGSTEDPSKGDSEPMITMAPVVDNIDVEPQEKNLVDFNVDVSIIQTSTIKVDTNLTSNETVETTPVNQIIVETNISKTEVMNASPNTKVNSNINQPENVVLETNLTEIYLVDLKPQTPVVLEANITKTEVADASSPNPTNVESNIPDAVMLNTRSPKPANVETNQSSNVNVDFMDNSVLKPVTEKGPNKNPNVFTINVYSINKDQGQKFFPSVLTKTDKVQMDNVENISDYDYGDYSTESVNTPEDMNKKKRSGRGNHRSRKRIAKSLNKGEKKPLDREIDTSAHFA